VLKDEYFVPNYKDMVFTLNLQKINFELTLNCPLRKINRL